MYPIHKQVKDMLNVKTVMEHYGIEFGRSGFARCCFHEEKTASLSVKGSYWKCFGCGAGGDVISFVMKHFGLSFPQAVIRLNDDFRLGLTSQKPSREKITAMQRERNKKRIELEGLQAEYMYNTKYYQLLFRAYKTRKPKSPDSPIDSRYAEACKRLPALAYWFDTHDWPRG